MKLIFQNSTVNNFQYNTILNGGAVEQRVEHWTRDQQVMGSNPTRGKSCIKLWASCSKFKLLASCSHLYASVTMQYNLVPAKGQWCSAAGKVAAGLAESSGSLPPGGWLPIHRDQFRAQRSVSRIGSLYLFVILNNSLDCLTYFLCQNQLNAFGHYDKTSAYDGQTDRHLTIAYTALCIVKTSK